jgi:hypothetical protein
MILSLHPDIRIQKLTIGSERRPLIVIDNLIADPDKLIRRAATRPYVDLPSYFPGIRAGAPLAYQHLFETQLKGMLLDYFQLENRTFKFQMCHYSLVTRRPDKLDFLQRIPHIDSVSSHGLASVHYLFKGNYGGTAFYRHRKTGFEYVDESRKETYYACLETEKHGPHAPTEGYINGDTALYEQIAKYDGVFNRVLIYRKNSLHSGCIDKDFVPDPNPLTGRLSINTFIDVVP